MEIIVDPDRMDSMVTHVGSYVSPELAPFRWRQRKWVREAQRRGTQADGSHAHVADEYWMPLYRTFRTSRALSEYLWEEKGYGALKPNSVESSVQRGPVLLSHHASRYHELGPQL